MGAAIFKILTAREWHETQSAGKFTGSDVDRRDGFIHFSTAEQLRETAERHFAGQSGLVLLAVDPERCPAGTLRYEPSRGGQLFPHLYAALDVAWVMREGTLGVKDGKFQFPDWAQPGSVQAS